MLNEEDLAAHASAFEQTHDGTTVRYAWSCGYTFSKSERLYLVEMLRYATTASFFGIFDKTPEEIFDMMKKYNEYRGGKYPAYRQTELQLNEQEAFTEPETFYVQEGWK